jgi:prevent-host-death family protein
MASVPVTELKAHLAKYLRMAQRGVEVQVLERGVPIARLTALPRAHDESEEAGLDRLVRAGIVRRGEGNVRALIGKRLVAQAGLRQALDEEREDRA